MTDLRFDESTHTYTVDGVIVPSVTGIINEVTRPFYPVAGMKWYMDRGTAIHACMAFLIRGIEIEYDDQIAGFVDAGRRWIADYNPAPIACEQPMASKYGYCGTPDLCAEVAKLGATVVDYKSGICGTAMWQLGAYSILCEENGIAKPKSLMSVRLKEDGTYDVKWWVAKAMQREWLNVLSVYKMMTREGMIK